MLTHLDLLKPSLDQKFLGGLHRMESWRYGKCLVSGESGEGSIRVGEALTKDKKSRAGCFRFFARLEVILPCPVRWW